MDGFMELGAVCCRRFPCNGEEDGGKVDKSKNIMRMELRCCLVRGKWEPYPYLIAILGRDWNTNQVESFPSKVSMGLAHEFLQFQRWVPPTTPPSF